VAGLSAAGGQPGLERVTLSVEARPREADAQHPRLEVWPEQGVLSLRVVDPGRLLVKAGEEVLAAGALGWGEDGRLRMDVLQASPPTLLPRVVNREPGREEVEVLIPADVGAGELLTLTYEWDWKHTGTPALVRTWLLPSMVDPARPELLWVPSHASRQELASRLFGDASAVGAFDFEPLAAPPDAEGGPRLCVRVRHPEALLPELLSAMRRALDLQLAADVAWTRAQLSAQSLDRNGAAALVERSLLWSQRSHLLDGSGQSYFDRYLQALAPLEEAKILEKAKQLRAALKLPENLSGGAP
jgi:hypothetical protein